MHDKDATPIEAIDFETLHQPAEQHQDLTQNSNRKTILWFVFIALVLSALLVFLFLPNYVDEKRNKSIATKQSQTEKIPLTEVPNISIEEISTEAVKEQVVELSAEELSELKQEAEELLLQLIGKQNILESKAVNKWAAEKFRIALTLGTDGDEHLRKQEYQLAITSYKDAVIVLDDLEKQIAPILAENLEKGELALTQAENITAIIHFELAKTIDADNVQAINGLKRADTIEELYVLLDQGGKLEATNRFVDAKNSYLKATKLDPLSVDAKQAFDRVSNRLTQNEFIQLINQGYAALKVRQYSDARSAFIAAQELSPNSDKPKQGIASIEQAVRSEKLSALSAEAQHFEEIEDWSNAANSYQQILTLSSDLTSAQQGLKRSRKRESLLTRLEENINNPLRLGSEQVMDEAKQLLKEIAAINSPGNKIQQDAIELNELIQLANQPVSITLESDNQTEIAIFKIGRFGKFEQQKVELKMGKYTILGSRSGFRDVRKVLTVTPDMRNKTILVRCDEPI